MGPHECGCPCHSGAEGMFHCWGACCSAPDVITDAPMPEPPDPDDEIAGDES